MSWRGPVSALGTLLLIAGLGGFAFVVTAPVLPHAVLAPISDVFDGRPITTTGESARRPTNLPPIAHSARPITRVVIASIGLDTEVTPAPVVDHDGATTWQVPRFIAGHAEGSAGAGEPGNAVLLGHVTSLTLGNVFEHLNQVQVGDPISVYSDSAEFDYVATEVTPVARTDMDVLASTTTPTLTLITCTGAWLPTVWDYAERLIVSAELRH